MKKVSRYKIITLFILQVLAACSSENRDTTSNSGRVESIPGPPAINYGVVNMYPHDTTSFTEGLLFHEGKLYESTGSPKDLLQTRSVVGVVNLQTGEIEEKVELDRNKYFGEGIVFLRNKLYQLTYLTKVGFIYDAATFKQTGTFTFPSKEGWGLTTDGAYLIMSDGTSKLTYLDPHSLTEVKALHVHDNNGPVMKINELEYINGFIYGNIYGTNDIVKIDPGTGKVAGRMDLTSLAGDAKSRNPGSLEMNGIAFDSVANSMYVTGKLWANIYEIKVDQ